MEKERPELPLKECKEVAQVKWDRGVQGIPRRGNRMSKTRKTSNSSQQLVLESKSSLVLLDIGLESVSNSEAGKLHKSQVI